MGIKSGIEYRKRYHEDPRLPAHPYQVYGALWEGFARFLGDESVFDPKLLNLYPKFWESIQSHVEEGTNQANKYSHLKAFLKDYVAELDLVDDPGALLSRDIPFNARVYETFVNATGDTQRNHGIASVRFF